MDRGDRRHQRERNRDRWRRHVQSWSRSTRSDEVWAEAFIRRAAEHGKLRSDCMCCSNPRLRGELTMQELRAADEASVDL